MFVRFEECVLMEILKAFDEYESAALAAIGATTSAVQLEQARIEFLGQKKGKLRDLQSLIGKATKEETAELLAEGIEVATIPWIDKSEN